MKKLLIASLLLSFLFVGSAYGQENEDAMSRIEQSTKRIQGEAREKIGDNVGKRVREMRQEKEEEGEDFGKRVREMVQARAREIREERREQAEEARKNFENKVDEMPEQAKRFAGMPEGLNKMNEQVSSRYEAFLEDVEEIVGSLESEELDEEQEEELSSIEEDVTSLWEELPEKSAKSYYEEFEGGDDMSFMADMMQAFREDHVGFMQEVISLRQDAKSLYEEVTGKEFEDEEEEEEDEKQNEEQEEEEE